MRGVHQCPDHGFFAAETCPDCGAVRTAVLSGEQRETLSRFLSYALRHGPGDAGIEPSDAGWAEFDDVVVAAAGQYDWPEATAITGVVALDPKGRFEVDGGRIRAVYGHSIDVELGTTDHPVPDMLYHGTDPDDIPQISREGLRSMDRQLVHLSESKTAALDVGRRHASDPELLLIDAAGMLTDWHEITKRGRNLYTTERVPPGFITRSAEDSD
ncbi:MAG: RNA 2'-phosphotransferase [Halobellus sp.]|uniref:RNA 2'-phosphotransferase n=1 Tax=Halobellus sp. TaxID=1979212 RepID=UPI0035D4DB81